MEVELWPRENESEPLPFPSPNPVDKGALVFLVASHRLHAKSNSSTGDRTHPGPSQKQVGTLSNHSYLWDLEALIPPIMGGQNEAYPPS